MSSDQSRPLWVMTQPPVVIVGGGPVGLASCPRARPSRGSIPDPRAPQGRHHVAPTGQDGVATHDGAPPALGPRRPTAPSGPRCRSPGRRRSCSARRCSAARSPGSRTASDSNWRAPTSSRSAASRSPNPTSSGSFVTRWRRRSSPIWSPASWWSGSRSMTTASMSSSRTKRAYARLVTAPYVLGCDGAGKQDARDDRREALRAATTRDRTSTSRSGLRSFRTACPHGPAIHYWVLNPDQPGLVGRLDLDGTWWGGGLGVDPATETRTPEEIVQNLLGEKIEIEVLSTDAWRASMLLADKYASKRVFLVGDAAHQNPPWGGHGFNTGVGDAVNLCWKLAAVLNGWAPESLLATYEEERRPIEALTIAVSAKNMRTLSTELSDPRLFGDDEEFADVVESVAAVILSSKDAEFHSLGLTLGYDYEGSSIVATEPGGADEFDDKTYVPTARPGHRLPHFWFAPGRLALRPPGSWVQSGRRSVLSGGEINHGRGRRTRHPAVGRRPWGRWARVTSSTPARPCPTRPARGVARRRTRTIRSGCCTWPSVRRRVRSLAHSTIGEDEHQ